MSNVLMVLDKYFPEFPGGTEIYVRALCKELSAHDFRPLVIYPCTSCDTITNYQWEGVEVFGVPAPNTGVSSTMLRDVLLKQGIQLIHYHVWNSGLPIALARLADELGIEQVMTMHHPAMVCPIETGIKFDMRPCAGARSFSECAACMLHRRGLPVLLAKLLAPLRQQLPELIFRRESARLWKNISAFVSHARWMNGFLNVYGVTTDKIYHVPQQQYMVGEMQADHPKPYSRLDEKTVVGFLGRCRKIKGADLLIRAVMLLPRRYDVRVQIHFSGEPNKRNAFYTNVRALAEKDSRVAILPAIPPDEVISNIAEWDVMVISSRCMETGPFTLFEAAQAGVPVIGADCSGIAEKIVHGKNGLLFAFNDVASLAAQLRLILDEPDLLDELKRNASAVLSKEFGMRNVDVYRKVLSRTAK